MQKIKTFFNWSSGKDAALALYHLQQDKTREVSRLLTTVNSYFGRVSMHGTRIELLEQQIKSIGTPFTMVELPKEPTMEEYSEKMSQELKLLIADGYKEAVFGDIFLEDLKEYRINQLRQLNLNACFPIWKRDTKELIKEFLDLGFRAIIVTINSSLLEPSFAGREIDRDFIKDLPKNVDPCGENGEFHTFCFDGPIFKTPVDFEIGEKVFKTYKSPNKDEEQDMGFWYADLMLKG